MKTWHAPYAEAAVRVRTFDGRELYARGDIAPWELECVPAKAPTLCDALDCPAGVYAVLAVQHLSGGRLVITVEDQPTLKRC